MATLSSRAANFAGYLQQVRGAAVGFGGVNGDATVAFSPTAMGTSVYAVGIISSPVEFNQNIETLTTRAAVMRLPYDEIITGMNPQVTLMVDQYSMWNLALGLSLDGESAVSGSSLLKFDMAFLKQVGAAGAAGGTAATDAGFHSCEIYAQAPPANAAAAAGTQSWQFWKTKVFSNGPIAWSGDALTQIPIRVQIFGNDADKAGEIDQNVAHTKATYAAG